MLDPGAPLFAWAWREAGIHRRGAEDAERIEEGSFTTENTEFTEERL